MKILKLILSVLFLVSGLTNSNGSHLMGGEITWRCDGIGAFIFQVKVYRDCNGIPGPGSLTLSTNAPGFSSGITCSLVSQTDISPQGIGCPSCSVPQGYANAVEEFVFQSAPTIIAGNPPSGGWYFYYNDCCRNSAISNLAAGAGDFTLRAVMYSFSGSTGSSCLDNSPYFAQSPNLAICATGQTDYSHAAFDPDLDSLVYSWDTPLQNGYPGIPYPFSAGYSIQSPLPGPLQNPLNSAAILDPASGIISFASFTVGAYVTVVKVSSYKCGQLVSEIYREIQVALLNCPISTTPTISDNHAPNFNLNNSPVETFQILAGDTFTYHFNATDFEFQPASSGGGPQSITATIESMEMGIGDSSYSIGCLIPPCAVLTNPGPITAPLAVSDTLIWPTACGHAGFTNGCLQHERVFQFVIRLDDNFCPAHGVRFKSLMVHVTGPEIYSNGSDLIVSYPGVSLQWYLNGVPIPGATDTIYTPLQNGIYTVLATNGTGCVMISNPVNRVLSGLDNIDKGSASSISVFPNPTSSNSMINVMVKNIEVGSNIIRVMDSSGRLVKQIPVNIRYSDEHLIIDLSAFSKGIYTINLSNKDQIVQTNLILK